MATVNKASMPQSSTARFESLCAEGCPPRAAPSSPHAVRAADGGVQEKHTPKSSANSSLPASQSPKLRHRPHPPRRQGQGPLVQRGALATSHPRASGCWRRLLRALRRRPHRPVHRSRAAHPRHRVREGRASRTPKSSTARAVTPSGRASPTRCPAPVRPRGLVGTCSSADALAQTPPNRCTPLSPAPVRGDAPGYIRAQLHHASPSGSAKPSSACHNRRCTSTSSLRTENHWHSAGLTVKRLHPKRGCEAIEESASSRATAASRCTTGP